MESNDAPDGQRANRPAGDLRTAARTLEAVAARDADPSTGLTAS